MRYLLLLLCAFGAAPAMAKSKKPKVHRPNVPSAQHRSEVEYEVLATTMFAGEGSGLGAALGVMVEDDLWLEVVGTGVTDTAPDAHDPNEVKHTDARFATLSLKSFLGNSFYLDVGAGERDRNESQTRMSSTTPEYTLHSRTAGLTAGLGNQWLFAHWTMGVEWIGAYVPVRTLEDSASDRPHLAAARSLDQAGSARLLNCYVGWQF